MSEKYKEHPAFQLMHTFSSYLKAEGYPILREEPDENSETFDLVFKSEGLTYMLLCDFKDTDYVRLMLPNFWQLESEEEKAAASIAMGVVAAKVKVAKLFLTPDGNGVISSCEFLSSKATVTAEHFKRYLTLTAHAAKVFAREMRGEA